MSIFSGIPKGCTVQLRGWNGSVWPERGSSRQIWYSQFPGERCHCKVKCQRHILPCRQLHELQVPLITAKREVTASAKIPPVNSFSNYWFQLCALLSTVNFLKYFPEGIIWNMETVSFLIELKYRWGKIQGPSRYPLKFTPQRWVFCAFVLPCQSTFLCI